MSFVVGVDSGGTFSDCVVIDEQGGVVRAKSPSTPPRFEEGVIGSVTEAAARLGQTLEELLAETTLFAHGTTVATNLLITRTGAKTALITTRGHEDAILIGRTVQKVAGLSEAEIIDVANLSKADPLVPRSSIFGVDERVDRNGDVVAPLNPARLDGLRERLREQGVEAIAVSLLWSFLNPGHERQLADWLGEGNGDGAPEWFVTASSDLVPVLREYERTSTTVLNAYLTPSVNGYLERMRERLRDAGHRGAIAVMHSAGGLSSIDEARRRGVSLLSSGPAGGMLGARALARRLELDRVIATDVGGTSFDVGMVVDGEPSYADAPVFAKYPVALPVIDVTSIGAGGGSIAWIEPETGVLKVGPRSAGAVPGPVCYGAGGTEPTVTDANLVLGRLNPDYFLGGRIRLDADAARAAVSGIAEPLGLTPQEAAAAVVDIVDSQMSDLIRRVTVERGLDPGEVHGLLLRRRRRAPRRGVRGQARLPRDRRAAHRGRLLGVRHRDERRKARGGGVRPDARAVRSGALERPARRARTLAQAEARRRAPPPPTTSCSAASSTSSCPGRCTRCACPSRPRTSRHTTAARESSLASSSCYEAKFGAGTAYRQAGVEAMTFTVEATARLPVPTAELLHSEGSDASHAL